MDIINEEIQDEYFILDVQVPLKFASPETISETKWTAPQSLKSHALEYVETYF